MSKLFEGFVVVTSNSAILFHGHYWDEPKWLPKSQVTIISAYDMDTVLLVSGWLCGKTGLEEFKHIRRHHDQQGNADMATENKNPN